MPGDFPDWCGMAVSYGVLLRCTGYVVRLVAVVRKVLHEMFDVLPAVC